MEATVKPILDEQSVLLVSGGAKGITAKCVIRIAEQTCCRFILVGRSTLLEEEPVWAQGLQDATQLQKSALDFFQSAGEKTNPKMLRGEVQRVISSREINSTLLQIKKHGGHAEYICADINDLATIRKFVNSAVERLGPVTGIIHGAGTLADKLIENKKGEDFDRVVNPKIYGLRNLLQSIDPTALCFVVLFSSVAGFFGNAGQTDYAIANELLNKSAYIIQRALPACRVICVNWGPWDSGMVSQEMKKLFAQRNIALISSDAGAQALMDELISEPRTTPQVVIGSSILSPVQFSSFKRDRFVQRRRLNLEDNPFLKDHHIGPHAVLPATCAAAWLADACLALHPGFYLRQMMDFKVLKGITFEKSHQEYEVVLEQRSALQENDSVYDVNVTSQNASNRKIFHYSGQVILSKDKPSCPVHQTVEYLNLTPKHKRDGLCLYQDGTLFHGPTFRGVREILLMEENKVISRVLLPEINEEIQGQFQVRATNPFINDAIVQNLLIWTQEFYSAPCLPSRLRQLNHYRLIPFGISVVAILEIKFHNEYAVSGDIIVQDEKGVEYMRFIGLEGTISKNLNRFIGRKSALY